MKRLVKQQQFVDDYINSSFKSLAKTSWVENRCTEEVLDVFQFPEVFQRWKISITNKHKDRQPQLNLHNAYSLFLILTHTHQPRKALSFSHQNKQALFPFYFLSLFLFHFLSLCISASLFPLIISHA